MRRLMSLENSLYHKKYREIYKLLFTADLDEVADHSNWYKTNKDIVEIKRPLWIIVESKILNKRIWITEDWGRLGIDTAQLDLDVNSKAYHDSYEWREFKNQKEMVKHLENLLEPCLLASKSTNELNNNVEEEEL